MSLNLTGLKEIQATKILLIEETSSGTVLTNILDLFPQASNITSDSTIDITRNGSQLALSLGTVQISDITGLQSALSSAGFDIKIGNITYNPSLLEITGDVLGTPTMTGGTLSIDLSSPTPSSLGSGVSIVGSSGDFKSIASSSSIAASSSASEISLSVVQIPQASVTGLETHLNGIATTLAGKQAVVSWKATPNGGNISSYSADSIHFSGTAVLSAALSSGVLEVNLQNTTNLTEVGGCTSIIHNSSGILRTLDGGTGITLNIVSNTVQISVHDIPIAKVLGLTSTITTLSTTSIQLQGLVSALFNTQVTSGGSSYTPRVLALSDITTSYNAGTETLSLSIPELSTLATSIATKCTIAEALSAVQSTSLAMISPQTVANTLISGGTGSAYMYMAHRTITNANIVTQFAFRQHSTGFTTINAAANKVIQFTENAVEKMRIRDGSLLINSTGATTDKLSVNGNALVTGVLKVGTSRSSSGGKAVLTIGSHALSDSAYFGHSGCGGTAHNADAGYHCSHHGFLIARSKANNYVEVANTNAGILAQFRPTFTYFTKNIECNGSIKGGRAMIGTVSTSYAAFYNSLLTPSLGTVALWQNGNLTGLNGGTDIQINIGGNSIALLDSSEFAISADLKVVGSHSFSVQGTKNFLIPAPASLGLEEGTKIRHACCESPNPMNIYTMQVDILEIDEQNTFNLPIYFDSINKNPLVFVSPYRHFGQAYGEVEDNKLIINANAIGVYNVAVWATRCDEGTASYVGGLIPPPNEHVFGAIPPDINEGSDNTEIDQEGQEVDGDDRAPFSSLWSEGSERLHDSQGSGEEEEISGQTQGEGELDEIGSDDPGISEQEPSLGGTESPGVSSEIEQEV